MRQILQPLNGENLKVVDVPAPSCPAGYVLIQNVCSAISPGTERYIRDLAMKSLAAKAKSRPDHVQRVFEKLQQEGIPDTIRQIRAKLDQPIPLGYSSAGVVAEVGEGVQAFRVGDRVVSNGPHAEFVLVPQNLVAPLHQDVDFEEGCYAVLGAIALQGVRLAQTGIGDRVVVLGLGLIGQLTAQILRASGAEVIGLDLNPSRVNLISDASMHGAKDTTSLRSLVSQITVGQGADAVLICAASDSNSLVELAADICRKKGRIVCVGAVGLDLPRKPFFEKEIEFVVSSSYGPGRYDPNYEERGQDYPYAYVRWTEQRNLTAVVELMAKKSLTIRSLKTRECSLDNVVQAYSDLENDSSCLSIVINYPKFLAPKIGSRLISISGNDDGNRSELPKRAEDQVRIAFIGAGGFGSGTLIPAFLDSRRFAPEILVTATGFKAAGLARKAKFKFQSTDVGQAINLPTTEAVVIATRHGEHADLVLKALGAGKHTFVEKPLAINFTDLDKIKEWKRNQARVDAAIPALMVGFNRRYSPPVSAIIDALSNLSAPRIVSIRMNAGAIPRNHWVHDAREGGGRLVGEACHAIDLAMHIVGGPIRSITTIGPDSSMQKSTEDDVLMAIDFGEKGVANVLYTSSGDRAGGKERVEVFCGGVFGVIDNFRSFEIFKNGKKVRKKKYWSQKKGYTEEVAFFNQLIQKPEMRSVVWNDVIMSAEASLMALQSLRERRTMSFGGKEPYEQNADRTSSKV